DHGEDPALRRPRHPARRGEPELEAAIALADDMGLAAGGAEGGTGTGTSTNPPGCLRQAGAAGAVEGGVGGGEGLVPVRGEGGASGAALRIAGAVHAQLAAGEAYVAGPAERLEEKPVLALLAAGEGSVGH